MKTCISLQMGENVHDVLELAPEVVVGNEKMDESTAEQGNKKSDGGKIHR